VFVISANGVENTGQEMRETQAQILSTIPLRRAEMSEVPGNDLSALPHTHTIKTLTIKTVL